MFPASSNQLLAGPPDWSKEVNSSPSSGADSQQLLGPGHRVWLRKGFTEYDHHYYINDISNCKRVTISTVYVCMYVCMYIYTYICISMYIYIYI